MTISTTQFTANGKPMTICADAYQALVHDASFDSYIASTSPEYEELAKTYGATDLTPA